jgi:hypothetical protein
MRKPIVITPVSPAQLAALRSTLTADDRNKVVDATGLPGSTPTGSFSWEGHGIGAQASIENETLTVTIVHKPWFLLESHIEASLRQELAPA